MTLEASENIVENWFKDILEQTTETIHIRNLLHADFPMVPSKYDLEETIRDYFLYMYVPYNQSVIKVKGITIKNEDDESQEMEDGLLIIYGEDNNSKSLCVDLIFYDLDQTLNNVRLYGNSFQRKLEISDEGDVEWIKELLYNRSYLQPQINKRYVLKEKSMGKFIWDFVCELFNIRKLAREFMYGYKG